MRERESTNECECTAKCLPHAPPRNPFWSFERILLWGTQSKYTQQIIINSSESHKIIIKVKCSLWEAKRYSLTRIRVIDVGFSHFLMGPQHWFEIKKKHTHEILNSFLKEFGISIYRLDFELKWLSNAHRQHWPNGKVCVGKSKQNMNMNGQLKLDVVVFLLNSSPLSPCQILNAIISTIVKFGFMELRILRFYFAHLAILLLGWRKNCFCAWQSRILNGHYHKLVINVNGNADADVACYYVGFWRMKSNQMWHF